MLSSLTCALLILVVSRAASASPLHSKSAPPEKKPNFVFILADDLDLTLGGPTFLPKTKRLVADKGANLTQWFVHTPICCPSRAEILTGRYFHNLKVADPNEKLRPGCMHVDVEPDESSPFYANYYFAKHFDEMGYKVGIFGKHLNNCNMKNTPPGVDHWLINGGGEYLNPSFTFASAGTEATDVLFDNCTNSDGHHLPCYSTSIIGNSSIAWIREKVESDPSAPFFAYVAVKAPHLQAGPGFPVAEPAPWYQDAPLVSTQAPRTPNYNASCPNHHWVVRQQLPLTELQASKVDELYRSRLRTLLSVDDLVEDMIHTLDELGVLDSTYVVFTSDNGYRLGQFRMPQGKYHPYENDVRVPFYARGPGVSPGTVRSDILGTHVDIMPTLLSLARGGEGGYIPSTMDGENLAPLLLKQSLGSSVVYRNVLLMEYGLGPVWRYEHLEDTYNNSFRAIRLIDPTLPEGWQNVKYVEFTDLRDDWNFTDDPLEVELFDLAKDPFELKNLASKVPTQLQIHLMKVLRKMFTCAGENCRGLYFQAPRNAVPVLQS